MMLSYHQVLLSQSTEQTNTGNYKAWVTLFYKFSTPCYLSTLEDSIIGFYTIAKNEIMYFKVEEINTLGFRKEGNVGKGFLYGALAGCAIGVIVGINMDEYPLDVYGPPSNSSERGLATGIAFAIPGALIGGLIGTAKVNIPIFGSQKNYNEQRAKLEKYKYSY